MGDSVLWRPVRLFSGAAISNTSLTRLCRRPFCPSGERNARRRPGGADALVGMSLEPFEIVGEHPPPAPRHFGELSLAAPSLDRFENVRLDARLLRWHGEAKVGIGAEIRALQRTVERGRDQTPCDRDRHTPSSADLPP